MRTWLRVFSVVLVAGGCSKDKADQAGDPAAAVKSPAQEPPAVDVPPPPPPAPQALPDDDLAPLQRRLIGAPALSLAFEGVLAVSPKGAEATRTTFRGILKLKPGNRVALDFTLDKQPEPFTIRFRSDGARMVFYDGEGKGFDVAPPHAADFMAGMLVRGGLVMFMLSLNYFQEPKVRQDGFPPTHEVLIAADIVKTETKLAFRADFTPTNLKTQHELTLDARGLPASRTARWIVPNRPGSVTETYSAVSLDPLPDSDFTVE